MWNFSSQSPTPTPTPCSVVASTQWTPAYYYNVKIIWKSYVKSCEKSYYKALLVLILFE